MKILIYAPNYRPATRYGGPIESSHGLAKALVECGHEVHVYTTNIDGPDILDVAIGEPVDIDGVKVSYFPVSWPKRIYNAPAMARAFKANLDNFDILHINGAFLWPGYNLARTARRNNIPYVYAPRGMLVKALIEAKSTLKKKLWIGCFERLVLKHAAVIHVTSRIEKQDLMDIGLNLSRNEIIENGVNSPPKRPNENSIWKDVLQGHRIAFLGRLDWKKGVDLAVEAVAAIPNIHLRLAGPDPIGLRAKLERKIADLNVTDRVKFIGPVTGVDKWEFLSDADILVVPSLNENFGIVVTEAMAVGTAVICTEGVGASEIVARIDPACVVERKRENLSQALMALHTDSARLNNFKTAGRELVLTELSWHAIAKRMETLFADIISASKTEQTL